MNLLDYCPFSRIQYENHNTKKPNYDKSKNKLISLGDKDIRKMFRLLLEEKEMKQKGVTVLEET